MLRVKFVTNMTKESLRVLHNRLVNLGFNIEEDEIVSSLWAAREFVKNESLKPFYLVDDDAVEDFEGFTGFGPTEANSVVIGLAAEEFNFFQANTAIRILLSGGRLVAIHGARYYMTEDGSLALGPGPFVKILEHETGCRATVVRKPSEDFYRMAVHIETDMQNNYMIGDDVKEDVGGAQKLDIK